MPNVGPFELAIVLIIALVVFGPKRLPELGRSLGKGIREFRGSVSGDSHEPAQPEAIEPPQAPVGACPRRGGAEERDGRSRSPLGTSLAR
jgi:sec-independent protein translocase protein TatA